MFAFSKKDAADLQQPHRKSCPPFVNYILNNLAAIKLHIDMRHDKKEKKWQIL